MNKKNEERRESMKRNEQLSMELSKPLFLYIYLLSFEKRVCVREENNIHVLA